MGLLDVIAGGGQGKGIEDCNNLERAILLRTLSAQDMLRIVVTLGHRGISETIVYCLSPPQASVSPFVVR